MPDEPEDLPPIAVGGDGEFTPALKAELYSLVDVLLDDAITPEPLRRLESIVLAHPEAAVLYYELVHLWCILPFHLSQGMIDLSEHVSATEFTAAAMDQSMVLPALREDDVASAEPPLRFAPPIPRAKPPRKSAFKWWAGAAAVVLFGVVLALRPWHRGAEVVVVRTAVAPVEVAPAVLTASAAAKFEGGDLLPGTALAVGDRIRLSHGAVELTFASAAVVVVRGPAQMRLVGRNRLALDVGSIAAHVPPSAHGFRIDSPGSSVVDRGTDFGVRSVAGSDHSEVAVFNGTVDAAPLDAAGRQIAAPVHVVTGHAMQLRVADPVPSAVAFKPATFDRDINAIRVPVAFHGTGVGIAPGAPDPNWQVITVPINSTWQARPAVVLSHPWPKYAPNSPDGQWVSLSDPQQDVANGQYVLRTTVDLTGIEPGTLDVRMKFAADNHVTDVRVNGISTGVSTLKLKSADDFGSYPVTLPTAAWHSGHNDIDIVLLNNASDGSDTPSFMAVQVTGTVSASPVVLR